MHASFAAGASAVPKPQVTTKGRTDRTEKALTWKHLELFHDLRRGPNGESPLQATMTPPIAHTSDSYFWIRGSCVCEPPPRDLYFRRLLEAGSQRTPLHQTRPAHLSCDGEPSRSPLLLTPLLSRCRRLSILGAEPGPLSLTQLDSRSSSPEELARC